LAVDELPLSEESLPVDKQTGDFVVGGHINGVSILRFETKRVGKKTALAEIIKLAWEVQGSKAPIQELANRVASIFMPSITGIALLTFVLLWTITRQFVPVMIRMVAALTGDNITTAKAIDVECGCQANAG
jgi:Cu+-exporting ATPase